MTRANRATSSRRPPAANVPQTWRITFAPDAAAEATVIRTFADPMPSVAIAEVAIESQVSSRAAWPDPENELLVAIVQDKNSSASLDAKWLIPPNHPDAPLPTSFSLGDCQVRWRPGRALIEGEIESPDALLAGLADFAFYEGRLRAIETEIASIEKAAPDDVARAYVIRSHDRSHWHRLRATMERLSQLRLLTARLEPHLYLKPRTLPAFARGIVTRLRARADVESRLESVSDRLEACEDLYEGAVDRITDHRWYRKGMWVEIAIVALLFLEVVQLAATMIFHGH